MVHRFGANRFKRFCFKMFSWVLVVSTYVEIFLRREHLNRLINVNLLYCGKSFYKGFIFMTLIIVSVLSANFCHLVTKKQIVKLLQSILWKENAKAARFWGFFFVSNRHIWTIGSNKYPKYSFLNSFIIVSDLYPILCNFSCAWLPVWLHHNFLFKKLWSSSFWVLSSIQTIY
jgi:hypothetical protein